MNLPVFCDRACLQEYAVHDVAQFLRWPCALITGTICCQWRKQSAIRLGVSLPNPSTAGLLLQNLFRRGGFADLQTLQLEGFDVSIYKIFGAWRSLPPLLARGTRPNWKMMPEECEWLKQLKSKEVWRKLAWWTQPFEHHEGYRRRTVIRLLVEDFWIQLSKEKVDLYRAQLFKDESPGGRSGYTATSDS